jgi:hypothetical protein
MSNSQPVNRLEYPPGKFVSVYITSKRIHAAKLLELRQHWERLYFTARWTIVRDIAAEQARPARFWMRDNHDDMIRSDVMLSYAEPEDALNTSIFEIGDAWAHGKPIYLVGENEGYKEWKHAEGIFHVKDLNVALQKITDRIRYQKTEAEAIQERLTQLQVKMLELHEPITKAMDKLQSDFKLLTTTVAVINEPGR